MVKSILHSSWNLGTNVQISSVDCNKFSCVFHKVTDTDRIVNASPWAVKSHIIALQQWTSSSIISELDFTYSPFWVQIHNIPPGNSVQLNLHNSVVNFVVGPPFSNPSLFCHPKPMVATLSQNERPTHIQTILSPNQVNLMQPNLLKRPLFSPPPSPKKPRLSNNSTSTRSACLDFFPNKLNDLPDTVPVSPSLTSPQSRPSRKRFIHLKKERLVGNIVPIAPLSSNESEFLSTDTVVGVAGLPPPSS